MWGVGGEYTSSSPTVGTTRSIVLDIYSCIYVFYRFSTSRQTLTWIPDSFFSRCTKQCIHLTVLLLNEEEICLV